MERRQRSPKAKCPYCGREYMPSELLYPENVLPSIGEPVRDEKGAIEFCTGSDELSSETYVCDGCGREFVVMPSLSVETFASEADIEEETFVPFAGA